MTLEELITQKMRQYPTLYQERWQCLHHMYLVNGNGYEWHNGGLLDIETMMARHIPRSPTNDQYEDKKFVAKYKLGPHQRNFLENADLSRWKLSLKSYNHWYPMSNYAAILEMKRNAKTSYRRGAVEIALYVLANPEHIAEYSTQYEDRMILPVCRSVLARYWKLTKQILKET